MAFSRIQHLIINDTNEIRTSGAELVIACDSNNQLGSSATIFTVDGTERARIDATGIQGNIGATTPGTGAFTTVTVSGDTAPQVTITGSGTNGAVQLYRQCSGTVASPTATQNGDIIANVQLRGYVDGAFTGNRGYIFGIANQNWTTGANGTRWEIGVAANGATVPGTIVSITSTGLAVTGTLSATGSVNFGTADTSTNVYTATINGGSGSGGGAYARFSRNGTPKIWIGTTQATVGTAEDSGSILAETALRLAINGSGTIANVTSSGLSVTGTLSASGQISANSTGAVIATANAGTAATYIQFQNTGGLNYFGIDNSTGATLASGNAYDLTAYADDGFSVVVAGIPRSRVSSTGLSVTGTGTFSSSLILADGTVGNATAAIYFSNDPNTGYYRAGADTLGFLAGGASIGTWSPTGLAVTGTLAAGNTTITGSVSATTGFTLNDGTANSPDLRFQTTSGTRLMDMDGSTIRILNLAATNARLQLTDAGNLTVDGSVTGGATDAVFSATGSTTNARYLRLANTTGDIYFGVNNSTGSAFGVSAYDGVIYSTTPLSISINGTVSRWQSTGLAVTGTLSATGNGTIGNGTASSYLSLYGSKAGETAVLFGNPTDGTTDGGIFYDAGSARGFTFRTAAGDNRMTLDGSGNLSVTGTITATSFFNSNLAIIGNRVEETVTNGLAALALNYAGYAQGTSQFRNVDIYDGKTALFTTFEGSTKTMRHHGPIDQGTTGIYQTYTSAGHTISLSVAAEQWIQLCTLSNRSYAVIRIGTGSNNSEEEAEITIATSYFTNQTYINVNRGTYNNHIREVRVTGTSGGSKTVFVKIRADSFSPTMVWKLIEARGFVSIDNSNTTPGSGESLVVGNHYRLTATNGVVLVGPNAFPLEDTYLGYSTTYRALRIGQNAAFRSLAFNVDPTAIGGGSFTGNGQILIGNNSILAPNSGGTDWMGVLRATGGNVYIGPNTSSGDCNGPITISPGGAFISGVAAIGVNGTISYYGLRVDSLVSGDDARGISCYPTITKTANNQTSYGVVLNGGILAKSTYTGLAHYGLFLNSPTVTGTGTLVNNYQLWIETGPSATNRYGIYQSGASDINWFYGKVYQYGGHGNSGIATSTANLGNFECYGNGTGAATISFHRPGAFACYLGVDTDNVLKVGGWSMGAVAYPILHSNNYNSYAPTLTGGGASGTWSININGTVSGNSVGTMASRNVTIQSGGSPSGGSDGDVYFIY